jgi:hypothetical protein
MRSQPTKSYPLVNVARARIAAFSLGLIASVGAMADSSFVISANIDGRDQLIIRSDTLRWHHFDFAAVGRHGGTNSQTIVESQFGQVEWQPEWPEPPPAQIRYEAFSSILTSGMNIVPAQERRWRLTKISGRGEVHVVAQPSAANGYRLIVEFNDNVPVGSSFYRVRFDTARRAVIDLRPKDRANAVTPDSSRSVQVAILSDSLGRGFDATLVTPGSVRFGRYETGPSQLTHVDVNGDGQLDALLTFPINQTGISCGDAEVWLTASTSTGLEVEGRDVVRTVDCQ